MDVDHPERRRLLAQMHENANEDACLKTSAKLPA